MSSIALTGLLTGLAQGAAARMDEEREEAKNNLELQIKSTYNNMQKYGNLITNLESEIRKRDEKIRQFAPDLEDNYRIAAATMPDLLPIYSQLLSRGEKVNIRDLIKVGEKASGSSFDNWLSNLRTMGLAEPSVDMFSAQKDSFFAPSEESRQKMAGQMAKSLGTSVEELSKFRTVPSVPTLAGYGSFAPEVSEKLLVKKSPEQLLQELAQQHIEVSKQYGKDSPQAQALVEEGNLIKNSRDIFGAGATTQLGLLNKLTLRLTELQTKGGDPAEIKDIEKKIKITSDNYLKYIDPPTEKEDPMETDSKLSGWFNRTIKNNFLNKFGTKHLTSTDWTYDTDTGMPKYSGKHTETGQYVQLEAQNIRIRALRMIAQPLLKDGRAVSRGVERFLQSNNLFTKDEQGRWVLPQEIKIPQNILDAVKAEDKKRAKNQSSTDQTTTVPEPIPTPVIPTPAPPPPPQAATAARSGRGIPQRKGSKSNPYGVITTQEELNRLPSGAFYRDDKSGKLVQKR